MKCRNCTNLHLIRECKNLLWCDDVLDAPDPDLERECKYFKQATNADRIRGKCETDEGLYAFILGVHSLTTDRYGDPDYRLVVEGEEFRDDERLLSWLKSPVEEIGDG